MRWAVVTVLTTAAFAFAGIGLAASSFSDTLGDNNEAPDVTSVTVSESPDGMLTITVAVANYQSLPENSWVNFWFDLDSNAATGDEGDEVLARYFSEGSLEFFRWNGTELVRQTPPGMSATYTGGVLTFTAPKTSLGVVASFGLLAVASRGQEVEQNQYTAADFAPNTGRSTYAGPGPVSFVDPSGDQPAAPDVSSVRVADSRDGTITFAITTPNFETLPRDAVILVLIDRDGKQSTGAGGADLMVIYQSGEVQVGHWDRMQRGFVANEPPLRVRARNADGVLTLFVHRSELDSPSRFGFAVGAGHLGGGDAFDALDVAPEARFWQYNVVNKPALRLTAGKAIGAPPRPVAGRRFTISVPVTRSDTGRPISAGSVRCNVRVAGATVPATGRVSSGNGRCAFVVPVTSSGKRVTGSMVVRAGGKTVTARFAFSVR